MPEQGSTACCPDIHYILELEGTVKKLLSILAISGLLSVGCNAESSKTSSPKTTAPAAPSKMTPGTGHAPAPTPPPAPPSTKK